jgi:hypothetical protein
MNLQMASSEICDEAASWLKQHVTRVSQQQSIPVNQMIVASCHSALHWYVVPTLGSIHICQCKLFHAVWCDIDHSCFSGDVTMP